MDALFALLAIVMLCAFFVLQLRVPAGVAPLATISTIIPWLLLCGLAGLLLPGAVLGAAVCIALGVFALAFHRGQGWIKRLFTPATVFFVLASLGVILYLWARKPVVSEWDEVSLWATVVKLLKVNNGLYTTAEMGWAWPATQTPSLPLLGYFFQLFGQYAEWKIYAGYDVLMLAVVAALIGTLEFKQYKLAVPLGVIGLLAPWFFTVYTRAIYVNNTWITSYGDIPAGMMYGGAVLVYLGLRGQGARLWPVLPVLMTAALVKDNNFVLALAAAGLIAADQLFFPPQKAAGMGLAPAGKATRFTGLRTLLDKWNRVPRIIHRLAFACVLVGGVFLFYRVWSSHVATVVRMREAVGETGDTNVDPITMVPVALSTLLGFTAPTAQFTGAWQDLLDAFLHTEIMMLPPVTVGGFKVGSGLAVTVLVLGMFVAAALLTRDKQLRRRSLVMMVLSTLCFAGYYFVMLVSYAYIFRPDQAADLVSYNRYFQPVYLGWFLIALGFLALAARDKKNERPYGLATGGILALCAVMLLRTTMLLQPQYTVLGYPEAFYAEARATKEKAGLVVETIQADEDEALSTRIFFVSQGDNGEGWFTYSYELLPLLLDYSGYSGEGALGGGGGTFGPPDYEKAASTAYFLPYTPEDLARYIAESGVGYVFIDVLDDLFRDTYAPLFADGLAGAEAGETLLYRVTFNGGTLLLVPVEMEVPA